MPSPIALRGNENYALFIAQIAEQYPPQTIDAERRANAKLQHGIWRDFAALRND
jgi:hypothetical protein